MKLTAKVACFLMLAMQFGEVGANAQGICPQKGEGLATGWYYEQVLARALETADPESVVNISIRKSGTESIIIIREHQGKFQLVEGRPEINVHRYLDQLDQSCSLPRNPAVMGDRIHVNWQVSELPSKRFIKLHSDFDAALLMYVHQIARRIKPLLATRESYINFHVAEFVVTYDNGYEHLKLYVDDLPTDPIAKWVHTTTEDGKIDMK